MKKLLVFLLLISGLGCAGKKPVAIHPGSITDYDSYAYDLLLTEQAAITEARAQFTAGNLPAAAHDPLKTAIKQYNAALAVWQGYHASGGDSTALQQAINALVAAVGALQGVLGKPKPMLMGPPHAMLLLGDEYVLTNY